MRPCGFQVRLHACVRAMACPSLCAARGQAVRGSRYEGGWRFQVELDPVSAGAEPPAPSPPAAAKPSPTPSDREAGGVPIEAAAAAGAAADGGGELPGPAQNPTGSAKHPGTTIAPAKAPERDWAPLLYAPAAGEAPAVAVRRPLDPARPPAPARTWEPGDRAEVRWRKEARAP